MAGQEQARTVGSEGRSQEQGQEAGAGARSDRLSQSCTSPGAWHAHASAASSTVSGPAQDKGLGAM